MPRTKMKMLKAANAILFENLLNQVGTLLCQLHACPLLLGSKGTGVQCISLAGRVKLCFGRKIRSATIVADCSLVV